MDKAEIVAALWMVNHDMSHLETLSDYIRQFDELSDQVRSLIPDDDQA